MIIFNYNVKKIDREYFKNIWQYGFLLLYTKIYEKVLYIIQYVFNQQFY